MAFWENSALRKVTFSVPVFVECGGAWIAKETWFDDREFKVGDVLLFRQNPKLPWQNAVVIEVKYSGDVIALHPSLIPCNAT